MQIGARIRDHRTQAGMSQDDLAMRVYVSRQTISSWENDKTYPDVQSLLLLSEIFDTSIDDLIKGDVETMTSTLDSDATTMKRLGYTMLGFLALMLLALIWQTVQLVVLGLAICPDVAHLRARTHAMGHRDVRSRLGGAHQKGA